MLQIGLVLLVFRVCVLAGIFQATNQSNSSSQSLFDQEEGGPGRGGAGGRG